MAVEPGTAQNIPVVAKFIILGLCIVAVVVVTSFSRLTQLFKGKKNPKS